MIDPLYSLSGFAVGLLVGMTGVGGGALMTPILIMLFGVHPATAVGTDLLYAAATRLAAAWSMALPVASIGVWSAGLQRGVSLRQFSRSRRYRISISAAMPHTT
jgi:uncharacterized membrane protein YfcA